jgi:hypothetical protein
MAFVEPRTAGPLGPLAKRQREDSDPDSESAQSYFDVRMHAVSQSEKYGVCWQHFIDSDIRGREQRVQAFRKIRSVIAQASVLTWYIGVCASPARRFFAELAPHKLRFDVLYPLFVGKNMGKKERNMLHVLQKCDDELTGRCLNKGAGGEHAKKKNVNFLYLCVKMADAEL